MKCYCKYITVTTIPNPPFSFNNSKLYQFFRSPKFLSNFFSSFPIFFYFLIKNRINYKRSSGYNALANALILFGPISGLYRVGAAHCSGVVWTLFGPSLGMFGCTQEKCEQSPNNVNSNTSKNPAGYGKPGWLVKTKIYPQEKQADFFANPPRLLRNVS